MSFDARQFFAVAESLVSDARREDGLREARLRTAYGRLYYGLYLIVRDMLIRKHGVPAPRLGHGALSGFLQHSRLADDVRKIGRELERLYALRRVSDYVLDLDGTTRRSLENPDVARGDVTRATATAGMVEKVDLGPAARLLSAR